MSLIFKQEENPPSIRAFAKLPLQQASTAPAVEKKRRSISDKDAAAIDRDVSNVRARRRPDSAVDPEADLRLLVYDYVLDEIVYVDGGDILYVGLWLGYGKRIGARCNELVAHRLSGVERSTEVPHYATIDLLGEEILQGDLDAFRRRLRSVDGAKTMYEAEREKRERKNLSMKDYESYTKELQELFDPVADAVDEMVVAFREGSENARTFEPMKLPAAPELSSWPFISITLPAHQYAMQWGLATLARAGLLKFNPARLPPTEIMQGFNRIDALTREVCDVAEGQYEFLYEKKGIPFSEDSRKLIRQTALYAAMFGTRWKLNGFPVFKPTHKLAASLMATHVPSDHLDEIKTPFSSFLIEVPQGLIPGCPVTHMGVIHSDTSETCDGSRFRYWVVRMTHNVANIFDGMEFGSLAEFEENSERLGVGDKLLARLVINVMIEAEQPSVREEILKVRKRLKDGEEPSVQKQKKVKKEDAAAKAWGIDLRRDIKVDVRTWVSDYVKHGGKSPSVQTLVRGHQKRQRHGSRGELRKWIHIAPYWRGPEDAPVVVRGHVMSARKEPIEKDET